MKCRRKEEYDCFYLTRDNTDEFLEWFNNLGLKYKYDYIKNYENYLFVATKHDEKHYNDFEFFTVIGVYLMEFSFYHIMTIRLKRFMI